MNSYEFRSCSFGPMDGSVSMWVWSCGVRMAYGIMDAAVVCVQCILLQYSRLYHRYIFSTQPSDAGSIRTSHTKRRHNTHKKKNKLMLTMTITTDDNWVACTFHFGAFECTCSALRTVVADVRRIRFFIFFSTIYVCRSYIRSLNLRALNTWLLRGSAENKQLISNRHYMVSK